jgi:tRNA nucleotidyltransferase/poly(A) polymerase
MEKLFSFYEVGGKVRDEILGLQSKDVDYTVVPSDSLLEQYTEAEEMFEILVTYLRETKFEIFLITPDCFTIRAMFPKDHKYSGVADFVMARREVGYIPGTRTPIVKPGTLYDDLERRDFTLNALAKDEDGTIIDYFNGLDHLKFKMLITPLDANLTMNDDPLRLLRALRFSITKDFKISNDIWNELNNFDYDEKMSVVSTERIREELFKCFKHDTIETLKKLEEFKYLRDYIFKNNLLWLKPTMEQ